MQVALASSPLSPAPLRKAGRAGQSDAGAQASAPASSRSAPSFAPAAATLAQVVLSVLLNVEQELEVIAADWIQELTGHEPPVSTPPVSMPPAITPPGTTPPATTPPVTAPSAPTPPASMPAASSSGTGGSAAGHGATISLPPALQAQVDAIIKQTAPVTARGPDPLAEPQALILAVQQKTAVAARVNEERTLLQVEVAQAVLATA